MRWQKETKIFLFLFFLLALTMHFGAWIDHPVAHIEALPSSSLGVWHPLFLTFVVYIVVVLIRMFIHGTKSLLKRKEL